jgi:hypothetical protein
MIILLVLITGCGGSQNIGGSNSGFGEITSESFESPPKFVDDEAVTPDPVSGVDIYSLPPGNENSIAYEIGAQEANSFILNGGLTRATYVNLGGLEQSCKFILDTFMALSGGSSTRQQYADFLLGCSSVVRSWY